jgi:hypothetical protein
MGTFGCPNSYTHFQQVRDILRLKALIVEIVIKCFEFATLDDGRSVHRSILLVLFAFLLASMLLTLCSALLSLPR